MLLVCDWLHYVGQNHFYVMMHLNKDTAIWSSSRRICIVYMSVKLGPLQPSRRCDIPSGCPIVQSFICPDLPLCREASNYSSLHQSRCFNSTSGRHSVLDQLWDFFLKHRYGKITATVRTMWILVRTCSSIRQVAHSNQTSGRRSSWSGRASFIYGNCVHQIHRLDDRCHGSDTCCEFKRVLASARIVCNIVCASARSNSQGNGQKSVSCSINLILT
jgi:hypothetical protein